MYTEICNRDENRPNNIVLAILEVKAEYKKRNIKLVKEMIDMFNTCESVIERQNLANNEMKELKQKLSQTTDENDKLIIEK